jgi:hypothetical protein
LNQNALLVKFIRLELELGLTFISLSQTRHSMGNLAEAKQSLAHARKAYQAVLKYLPRATLSEARKHWIEGKLKELEQGLEQLPK